MEKLPMTDEQGYIFDVNERSEGTPYHIAFDIKFTQSFAADRLRFAVEKCLLSADISGVGCCVDGDGKYMEFLPPVLEKIEAYNFQSIELYQECCDSIPENKVNNRNKLFNVFIYSIGDSFNNLHFCFNHVIFDGISAIVLYEKIQQVLLDENAEIHWHPFSSHLKKLAGASVEKNNVDDGQFWDTRFSELATCAPLFKDVIDVEESVASHLSFRLSKEIKEGLFSCCDKSKASPFTVILTFFAELLSEKCGGKRFCIEVPFGNRLGHEEKDSLGAYEIVAPFTFDFSEHKELVERIQSVKKQSREFCRHKDFDWNSKISSASCLMKYGRYVPQILLSYFCFNKNCSMGFATLHHYASKTCGFPINLYISDYLDCESIDFYYVFWRQCITPEVVFEIQNELEERLRSFSEGGSFSLGDVNNCKH